MVWALNDVRSRVKGSKIILHTDSNSAYQGVMGFPGDELPEDVRAPRFIGWIWASFPLVQ